MYIDWSDIEIKCALDKRLYINVNLPATKYDYRFGYYCSVEDFFEYVKDKTIVSPEDFIKLCN